MNDVFTLQQMATQRVEPDMNNKRGNKSALDQNLINLIKSE